jgi:ferredoxin-type protein NapG
MSKEEDRPVNRRGFFRASFRELMKPIAQAITPLEAAARELGKLENIGANKHPPRTLSLQQLWLRPPGAIDEQAFKETCSRCGECVRVCPAQCIKIDANGVKGNGAPYIEPNVMACVLCDGLLCMPACPSGALVPTPLVDVDIGTAFWHPERCVRKNGEDCRICVDTCPIGSVAIEVMDPSIVVHADGCTGCGVCQHECPTWPKAIDVMPKMARTV